MESEGAIAWPDVENSSDYQNLPQHEQQAAKEQYFSSVVAQKPEFQALPEADKHVAANQFLNPPDNPDMQGGIAQFTKGFGDAMHNIPGVRQFMDLNPELKAMGSEVKEPQGIGNKIARGVGEAAGYTPGVMAGAATLPAAPVLGPALGVGMQTATGAAQEGDNPLQAAGKGAVSAAATYAGGKVLNAAVGAAGETFKPVGQKITDTINDLYSKAVKPTIVKGNFNILNQADKNVESGIRAIVDNKHNLDLGEDGETLPKNLDQASQAVQDTKAAIFEKYNNMQKAATGQGVTINPQTLVKPLDDIINDKAMGVVSPKTAQYAQDLKERLVGRESTGPDDPGTPGAGPLTPEEAQNIIKGFNGRLKAFYKNPSPDQYGNTAVDALVANNARKQLDDAISNAVGEGYQGLKNQYGALSSMEKDITRASQRASNYVPKGLLDFSDIFTGDQIVKGILTGNPGEMVSGGIMRGFKEYYKNLNNPNAIISKMFDKVDQYMQAEKNPSLAAKFQEGLQTVKQKASSVLDALDIRNSNYGFGMAGKVGSGGQATPVEAELLGGKRLPAPPTPIRPGRRLPGPGDAGNVDASVIPQPQAGGVPRGITQQEGMGPEIAPTQAQSIRPELETKYPQTHTQAQPINVPNNMPKVPTQAEIDTVNSAPKSADDRRSITRILNKYGVTSADKLNEIWKSAGLPAAAAVGVGSAQGKPKPINVPINANSAQLDGIKKQLGAVENFNKTTGNYAHITPVVVRDLIQHGMLFKGYTFNQAMKDPKLYDNVVQKYWKLIGDKYGVPESQKYLWWRRPLDYKRTGGDINQLKHPQDRNQMFNRVKNHNAALRGGK